MQENEKNSNVLLYVANLLSCRFIMLQIYVERPSSVRGPAARARAVPPPHRCIWGIIWVGLRERDGMHRKLSPCKNFVNIGQEF